MNLWEKFQSRTLVYGGSAALSILLVAGILVFIILLGNRYSLRWDLTRSQSHSLSAVSRALLDQVDKPLTLTAYFPDGHPERQRAREILELYTRQNSHLSLRFMDPEKDPLAADQAGYRRPGNVLLEYEGRKQLAETFDEEHLSEAIRKVLQKQRKKIAFLTGHGERSDARERRGFKTARKALQGEGFELADLNLLKEGEVPKDIAVVVIAAPQKDLLPPEAEALKKYVDRDGRLLILLEPFHDRGLKNLLAGYGINLDNGVIFEFNQLTQDRAILSPIITQYGQHRLFQDFTLFTIFPRPRPLLLNQELKTVTLTPLISTSPQSWEKFGIGWQKQGQQGNKPLYDPQQDKKGPFTIAALAEPKPSRKPKDAEAKPEKDSIEPKAGENQPESGPQAYVAVFGDVDFAADEFFNQLGNGDLFLNTVNFLAAEEKQIIIRKDRQKLEPLTLTAWKTLIIFFLSVILLPLIMLTAGVAVYVRRRALR
ncbi:MAG: GldG family protein [Desulfobaccales bacterium]